MALKSVGNTIDQQKYMLGQITKWDKVTINAHLQALTNGIVHYPIFLELFSVEFEHLRRQQKAYSWLITVEEKIATYHQNLENTIKAINNADTIFKVDLLEFLDIPRPPVFYLNLDMLVDFVQLAVKILNSIHFNDSVAETLMLGTFVNHQKKCS